MKTRYRMDGVIMPYDKDVGLEGQRKNSLWIIVMAVMYNNKNQPVAADLIPIWWNLPENIKPTEEVEITEKLYMNGESLVTINKKSWRKRSKAYHDAYKFCDTVLRKKHWLSLEEMSKYHELEFISFTKPMKYLYSQQNDQVLS